MKCTTYLTILNLKQTDLLSFILLTKVISIIQCIYTVPYKFFEFTVAV